MATDEKKEPARRRRAAAAPAEEGVTKPARPTRARKPKAEAEAASAPVEVAAGAPTVEPAVATAEEVVGAPTAPGDQVAEAGGLPADGQGTEAALTPAEVTAVLGNLLRLSGLEAELDVQDAADGSLSVAVNFDPVPPGIQAGRRTPLMESLQFLTNKLVNRPGSASRRWVALGAMGHPPPRPAPGTRPAKGQAQAQARGAAGAQAPAASTAEVPVKAPTEKAQQPARSPHEGAAARSDERSMSVEPDAALGEASRRLSENAAKLGRYYVLFPMKEEDRARVVQAAAGTPGVRVSCEGEGRHRRVVFKPDAPTPLPKQTLPDYDDEDDDDAA